MLTLRADRVLNVCQARMLEEVVVEKEVAEATKKAREQIEALLEGRDLIDNIGNIMDLPLDDPTAPDPLAPGAGGATRRNLGPLAPETLPTGNDHNPFPSLERPLG